MNCKPAFGIEFDFEAEAVIEIGAGLEEFGAGLGGRFVVEAGIEAGDGPEVFGKSGGSPGNIPVKTDLRACIRFGGP